MNTTMVKILSIGGLALSVAGAIITNIASNQTTKLAIDAAVNAKIAELSK